MTVSAGAASWDTTFHGGGGRKGRQRRFLAGGSRWCGNGLARGRESYHPTRGADVRAEPSPALVAPVDLPGDAGNLRDRPRDLVQTAGDYRGSPRIDPPDRDRADLAGRKLPATGCVRLPVDRFHAGRTARELL